jgi:hypothetical protein
MRRDGREAKHNEDNSRFSQFCESAQKLIGFFYREMIAVCSEINTKHRSSLCGQNVELLNVQLLLPVL